MMGGSTSSANASEAVLGWLDAMRRGDLDAVSEWLDPKVTWRGVGEDAVCRNRREVVEMLGDSLIPCPEDPEAFEPHYGLRGAEAIELIAAGTQMAVLGAKLPGLSEAGGIEAHGQLFSVFRVSSGRIVEVVDYVERREALAAAGVQSPAWR